MKSTTRQLLERIEALGVADLQAVANRAAKLGVGGSLWEEAWLAARIGQAAGLVAQERALAKGASLLAAAALAGVVAACEADEELTSAQHRTLAAPLEVIDLPPVTGPIGHWRLFAPAAA
jgi:hypothetical protein